MARFEWLDPEEYRGYELNFSYTTQRYYHVHVTSMGMMLEEKEFSQPVEKQFTDHLFESWLEDPVALGAFDGNHLAGVIEGSMEAWHDVFRISNLLVMKPFRGVGVGSGLMERMLSHAGKIPKCRGIILETQSCNYPAISFYRSHGFELSRIDLREYTNEDIQRGEVRLDFFRPFPSAEK